MLLKGAVKLRNVATVHEKNDVISSKFNSHTMDFFLNSLCVLMFLSICRLLIYSPWIRVAPYLTVLRIFSFSTCINDELSSNNTFVEILNILFRTNHTELE